MKLEGEWVILGDEIYLWQATWEDFLERQICSTQNILDSLLITHGERLNNESLRTQVENILILGQ